MWLVRFRYGWRDREESEVEQEERIYGSELWDEKSNDDDDDGCDDDGMATSCRLRSFALLIRLPACRSSATALALKTRRKKTTGLAG